MDEKVLVKRHTSEEKVTFAPSWFAQFLARKRIWAWPFKYLSRISYLYPARLAPLTTRMSVEKPYRDLADRIFRYHQDQRHTGANLSMQVFTIAALAGNTWSGDSDGFRWYPLAAFKTVGKEHSNFVTSSLNAIYKVAIEHFGHNVLQRPEARIFLHSLDLKQTGVDAFDWTLRPTPYNTQVASKLLGMPVTDVPAHVRSWARLLREILPLFQVKTTEKVESSLNLWLIFLMRLRPEDAPVDFQSLSRVKHIHDIRREHTDTYRNFLNLHFENDARDQGNRALGTFQKAFYLASVRDGFQHLNNPVEMELDRIARKKAGKPDITPRKSLELEAWELLVRKYREDDYAFARSFGPKRYHYTLRNPETGEYERVFWPAEAIIVDIILNSGMLHISARWADSGEGDEKTLDIKNMDTVTNLHPAATLKRKESFLQLVDIPGREKRKIIGMNVGINKTGEPFVIPWTDNGIIDAFEKMRSLQAKYNPIRFSVKQKDGLLRVFVSGAGDLFPGVYPLFRDPDSKTNEAVSSAKVLTYWKALFRACQPAVNKLFGHDYPLIDDDGMVFDLHAFRVTMITNLLEAGVSIEVVMDLVGHATWIMTWHYNARRSNALHSAVQEMMARRTEAHDSLASGDRATILRYADNTVKPDFVIDHVGKEMLRSYASRKNLTPFSIFSHGICPGGDCATGGERISEGKYKPVWRDRACGECRYRATGPDFAHGIITHINNLKAEMRLSAKRSSKLGDEIECIEAETGKPAHGLRRAQHAESSFRNNLSREFAAETKMLALIRQVMAVAKDAGKTTEGILLPSVAGFDTSDLEYGFSEVHDFELMHMLVKDVRIIPSAIMDIPYGVDEHMKEIMRLILRANNLADISFRLSSSQETDFCISVGDAMLQEYPEPSRFQQLVEGTLELSAELCGLIRGEVEKLLSDAPRPVRRIEAAS